jgi:hypothetical protein
MSKDLFREDCGHWTASYYEETFNCSVRSGLKLQDTPMSMQLGVGVDSDIATAP